MKYTFIMPAYNAGNTIEKAIKSIMEQTYNDLQIIVVDDGSTDNTLDIIKTLFFEDNRIEYYHKENGGIGSALIMGFQKIKGDYTLFVDSDDFIDNNLVENVNEVINKTDSDVIQFGLTRYNRDGTKHSELLYKEATLTGTDAILKDYLYGCLKGINSPGLSMRAIRSSILNDFNYYSSSLAIDEVLVVHVLTRTKSLTYMSGSYYNLIIYSTSISRSKVTAEKVKGQYIGLSLLPSLVSDQDGEIKLLVVIKLMGFIANNYNFFIEAYGQAETKKKVKDLYNVYRGNIKCGSVSKGLKLYFWCLRYAPNIIKFKN